MSHAIPLAGYSPMNGNRELARRLIDRLPEEQLFRLAQFLKAIVDPAAPALRNASLDDTTAM
jgi:hypothetical protein